MKIFGIGLPRTGTTSLISALTILGYRSIHLPIDETTAYEIMRGNFRFSVLEDYDALADTCAVSYYAQFDKLFHDSKFILTVREKRSWLTSSENHWSRYDWLPESETITDWELIKFINGIVYGTYVFNQDRFEYVYDNHVANVREYFKDRPKDLLEMNICKGDGWDKLCQFLGKPIPDQSFPHDNQQPGKVPLI